VLDHRWLRLMLRGHTGMGVLSGSVLDKRRKHGV
jgi:hypothetical protein